MCNNNDREKAHSEKMLKSSHAHLYDVKDNSCETGLSIIGFNCINYDTYTVIFGSLFEVTYCLIVTKLNCSQICKLVCLHQLSMNLQFALELEHYKYIPFHY